MDTETRTSIDELLQGLSSRVQSDPLALEETTEEEKEPGKLKQRKPPAHGICRRCGKDKPINRLMLCYPCWVKTVLEKHGWREDLPHPSWCQCEDLKEHPRRSQGN